MGCTCLNRYELTQKITLLPNIILEASIPNPRSLISKKQTRPIIGLPGQLLGNILTAV